MKKSVITATWLGGLAAIVAGLIILGASIAVMLTSAGTWQTSTDGTSTFTPTEDPLFWTTIGGIILGGLIFVAGAMVQLVAWIGALVNTYHLPDKVWFVLLLILGIIGWGFVAMIAYILGAPEGLTGEAKPVAFPGPQPPEALPPAAPATPAPVT